MTSLNTIFATTAGMKGLAVVIVLIGAAIRYWIGRRNFNRRNFAGIQGFRSYEHMRVVVLLEGIARLIGLLLIIAGLLLFLFIYVANLSHHK